MKSMLSALSAKPSNVSKVVGSSRTEVEIFGFRMPNGLARRDPRLDPTKDFDLGTGGESALRIAALPPDKMTADAGSSIEGDVAYRFARNDRGIDLQHRADGVASARAAVGTAASPHKP